MKISCLNISNPKLNRLANDFGEIKVSELMDKYYPNSIPTYEEFIANKSIKQELGVIPISKVKDEIGVSFKKEISNQQLINLKKAISKTNDKIKDFVYLLFNVKQIGQADLYTWGLRKVKGNLNIQAKLDRAVQQSTNTVQSNSKINNLQDRVNKDRIQGTLFGLNTQNQEKLEFHINTLNVIGQFLENVGVEQRLVPEFLSQEGNVVEGAIAAANFIQGTVDIIDDVEKRPSAWNKLPEEAAHWWYRLLDKNSELKDALLTSALTDRKEEELRNSLYGKTYNGVKVVGKLALDSNGNVTSKPALSAIREEAIGQLIAEAIKRIETQNGSAADYSFFKKFLEWINSIIDIFKNTKQDPFEVAAMKILSSDMSDLMTWEEYRKLNNIVNFADVLTEQSVAPIDYTLIEDLGSFQIEPIPVRSERGIIITEPRFTWYSSDRINKKDSPNFTSQEELDLWVFQNYGNLLEQRQKQILQEVRDNQIFFDRLLNKTFRKKSKFLPKTLRKYFDIIDAQNLNPLREWNISQELQQITKKLSEQEKKQIIETNGYTNIAPTLKVLPDLLQKYGRKTTPEIIKQEIEITNKLVKKEITKEQATELRQKLENKKKGNPIVLSEPIKIDGAKKQELSILNGIKEMIKLENPNLKSITAEEFVAEAHNWLETNYLLGFANEKSYLSYRTDQTFTYLKDRISNEDFQLGNMTEEEIQRLPFEERQRIANIVGLTKQNPDVYHNKVSLRFNDMYHLKSGHFDKSPSAWGNLTYFYTGKSKWKDAVLLHEIQNDNIEALREFKVEKVDLETSLGRYLQQLNTDLIDNITQIESGNKRIQKNDIFSTNPPRQHFQLNHQLQQLYNLPLEQGLNQLKQRLNEKIELYKSDNSVTNNPEKAQEEVEKAYSQRRKFADFQRKGGIKSLLSEQELQNLKDVLNELNTGTVMTDAVYMPDENQYEPGYETIRNLKQKKQDFKLRAKSLEQKINSELTKLYGTGFPVITLEAPVKPLPKSQRRNQIVGHGENRRVIDNASQELNENVNFLIAFSEQKINKQLSKNIEESKKIYIQARNATNAYNFNVRLAKITQEQYNNLIENYKYNQDLLNRLIDEQAQKDIKNASDLQFQKETDLEKIKQDTVGWGIPGEYNPNGTPLRFNTKEQAEKYYEDKYNLNIQKNKQQSQFESLKQQALDKKAELEKNYGKIEEEVKQTLEIEMNYFTPLVHHLIQKHVNQYGKDFPMYFSGFNITKLTQGNDRTAWIYAGKDEIDIVNKSSFSFNGNTYESNWGTGYKKQSPFESFDYFKNDELISQQEYEKAYQQATEQRAKEIKFEAAQKIGLIPLISNEKKTSIEEGIKKLNEYKKQSKQNLDRVINTIMNISGNKPIETGAIYNAMSQISGVKLIWQDKIDGLQGNPGGYLVDLTNYNYNVPILYGLESKKQNNQKSPTSETNNNNLQEGLQWLKQIMPDVNPMLVDGLINNIANGSYDILEDLITLSKDFANKNVVKEEVFHKIFNLLPKKEQGKLLDEGSKKYGIERGESKATIKYSTADQNKIEYVLKAVEILQSDKAKQVFEKGRKANWDLNKILTELQIPKEQKQLILNSDITKNKVNVILPIGTSGSGKSTFIKSLPQENLVVIEPDAMRVEFTGDINNKSKDKEIYEEAAKRAIKAIKQGKQVVFDTTNLTKDKRLPFIEAIKKEIPTANIQYKLMELNPELAKQRIKAQIARGENRANVPDSTIDRHAESYKQMLDDIKSEPISEFKNTDLREQIALELTTQMSYTVEINTAKDSNKLIDWENNPNTTYFEFVVDGIKYTDSTYGYYYKRLPNTPKDVEISEEEYNKAKILSSKNIDAKPTQYYSNLTVPGGTNYTEQEIATPAITPSIKGHAQFATDKGIGWFRSDEQFINEHELMRNMKTENVGGVTKYYIYGQEVSKEKYRNILEGKIDNSTKTRRILEVQSDLFQKGRDKKDLAKNYQTGTALEYIINGTHTLETSLDSYKKYLEEYDAEADEIIESIAIEKEKLQKGLKEYNSQNQFLQLLNKDNNWVTFFIKSIIQDSAKKGYEKVLFPLGETIAKIEQYGEAAKIYAKLLAKKQRGEKLTVQEENAAKEYEELNQKAVIDFYENTVTNILKKQGYNPNVITDEYGNTWNEITITPKMAETIRLNTPNGKVKYTGDLAIEEKIAEEAYNSKDEKIPTTLIGKFIQSVRNLFRNIFKETNRISRLIRDLNQGRVINQINNQISPQNTNEDTSRIFYQLAPDTTRTKLNNELELFISNLLNRMGVKKMTFKKYLEEYSKANPDKKINMVAFADMMNKIIAFSEARDGTTMPEEAWHFLIEMFWDEPFIKELRNLVDENGIPEFKNTELWKTQSELYKGVYSETIKDPNKLEEKVEKEIIAKLLAQNIYDQFKEEGSLSHRVINVLKKLLNYIAKKLGLKIRLAKITQTEVNTKVNEILNKLNLGLRYGEFNNLISNKFAEPGKEIDINNEEVPAQYKIPGIKDIFSHAAAIKSINFLKARIQQLTNTKTGLYNELLHKQWKEYEQIIKNNISDFEFTNIRDLLEEVNKFKIRNTNSLDVERMKLIDDAVEKLKILSRKKDIDKAKQDQLLKLNLRLGLLRKEYSEKRFSAAIFTFFFGTDGTIDISSEQDEEKVELSSEGAIADLNRTLTFINNVQNNGHELTPERFQMVVDAYAFYEPVINGLHGIFKSGYNFPELTDDQNKKLKETMDLLSKVHIKDINDFLIEKSTSSVKAELKRYAEETGTMNDLLAQRLESDTVNLGNISSIRHYFFAASNSNEDWLSIFNRKIVDTLNKIIRRSNDDYVNLVKSLENELKSMSDFDMRSIMEKDENGKVNGYFLNKYNVEKFNKALEEHGIKLIKSLNKELQDNGIKSQIPEDRETRHSWFRGEFLQMYDSNKWNAYLTLIKDNKGIIPQEIKSEYEILLTEKRQYEKNKKLINNIKIKYDREWAKWFNANTMVNPEKDIIIALRKSTMSESEFNMWYNSVVKRVYDFNGELLSEYYRGELSVPSDGTIKGDIFEDPITGNNVNIQTIDYRNEEYDKLNPDVKKVLNKFLEFKKRADLRLGISFTYEMSMRLPQIPRSKSDLVANRFKGLKGALKEGIADVFKERSHTPLFGEELNGNVLQKPRIRFIKKIDNIENISQDLLRTLVQYNEMSINYEEFIDAKPELDGMIHIAKYNKNKQKRDKVFPGPENIRENILTAFNSKFKNIFKKEEGDSDDYLVRKMENLLSSHVYGIKYTDNSNFAKRIGPFMNWFSQYVRNRRLGGNVTSITKGLVSAIVDTIGQSLIKRYTTIEDYTYGMTEYLREQPRMNWELNSLLKTTKIESVANYMDLVGSLSRTSGNHTRNRAIKVISNSIDYGLWGYSDKMLKYPMMVAIGNNLRYYNGKLYSSQNWPGTKEEYSKANTFWSLINSENGKVTFDKTVSESDINYFTNYVKTVSSRLDGQILSTDKGAIYNHPILQLATITTGFLFQQIDLGIKGEHYNYLTNQREIGYLNNLKNFDKIIGFGWNTMNNAEKNAARQLYMFMITAAVLNVLAFTLQAAGADDKPEDNPFRKFLTYTVTGAAIEHLSRYSADDITRYAQTPFSSIDEYNRIVDALTMIPGLFIDGTDDIGKGSLYTGYDRSTKALIRAIPHVRGWYETLWGGYINEYTGLGAQTIGASYHYKNQFIRNNIYNKSYGIGITWPSRVIGNTLGDIVSNSMGYEYEIDGFTQMPTKKNKNKTKKTMKTR